MCFLVFANSGAASDSVNLMEVWHFGQEIRGSFVPISLTVISDLCNLLMEVPTAYKGRALMIALIFVEPGWTAKGSVQSLKLPVGPPSHFAAVRVKLMMVLLGR